MHLHEDLCGKMVWNMAMGQDMALEPISMCMKVLRSSFGGSMSDLRPPPPFWLEGKLPEISREIWEGW